MKINISFSDFLRAFKEYNRENNFSYDGKYALYNYFMDLEEETGTETTLDVIALCCDFTEYKNFKELQENYNVKSMDELRENTIVIPVYRKSFIIQNY